MATTELQNCLCCESTVSPVERNLFDTRFGIPGPFSIGKCARCRLVQISPRPSPDALQNYYEHYYNFEGHDNARYQWLRRQLFNSLLYKIWIFLDGDISFQARTGTGRLLDVGCNEGRNLRIYQNNGFKVEGLETNSVAAEKARQAGFTIHVEDVGQMNSTGKFDVVVLSNVLEHFLDPILKLKQIGNILNSNGQIWISCPNYNSWLRRVFGRFWINWHIPFHISQFTLPTLSNLLSSAGFEVRESVTLTPSLWAAQSVLAAIFAKQGYATRQLRSSVLVAGLMLFFRGLLFPLLWILNKLGKGDCLVIIAGKTSR